MTDTPPPLREILAEAIYGCCTAAATMEHADHILAHPAMQSYVALQQRVAEGEALFDLRWRADQRAIKRWQEAHPERMAESEGGMWPDHADMVVWLMERVAVLEAGLQKYQTALGELCELVTRHEDATECGCGDFDDWFQTWDGPALRLQSVDALLTSEPAP